MLTHLAHHPPASRRRRRHRPLATRRRHDAHRRERHRRRPRPARPQGRDARDPRRRAGQALQPDHRLREPRHRAPASTCTCTTWRWATSSATTRSAPTRSRRSTSQPPATFQGIVRADGRVATRNYIGILSRVNCSATVARGIAEQFTRERLAAYPNVDGVVALTHGSGCGMDTHGEGMTCCAARSAATRGTRISPACWSSAWAARRTRSTRCSPRRR